MKLNDATPEEWDTAYHSYDRGYTSGPPKQWTREHKKQMNLFQGDIAEDNVNKPPHYNNGDIECIDAIKAMLTKEEYIGYLRGNTLKYRWRMWYKGKTIEDLSKAAWYDEKLLKAVEAYIQGEK